MGAAALRGSVLNGIAARPRRAQNGAVHTEGTATRISVSGDKALVERLEAAVQADGAATERPAQQRDPTEQAFGIAEVATVVAILTGVAKLIEYLVMVAKALNDDEKQTVRVKTALGVVTLELHADVSAAELRRTLASLEAQR